MKYYLPLSIITLVSCSDPWQLVTASSEKDSSDVNEVEHDSLDNVNTTDTFLGSTEEEFYQALEKAGYRPEDAQEIEGVYNVTTDDIPGHLRKRHLVGCRYPQVVPKPPLYAVTVRWYGIYVHYTGDDWGDYEEWKLNLAIGYPGWVHHDPSVDCDLRPNDVIKKRVDFNVRDRRNPRYYDFRDVYLTKYSIGPSGQYELTSWGKEDDGGAWDDHLPWMRVYHRQGQTGYWQRHARSGGRAYTIYYQLSERRTL